jgi:hypothetical protein
VTSSDGSEAQRALALEIILGGPAKTNEAKAMRARFERFFDPMSDDVVAAFASWMSLRYWLGEDSTGDARGWHGVWLLQGSSTGGRVDGTSVRALLPGFAQLLFDIAGSVSDAVQSMAGIAGFWASAGQQFKAMLDGIIGGADGRLQQIKNRTLTAITPWAEDWFSFPVGLREFLHESIAGHRERRLDRSLTRPYTEQKFRSIYTISQIMLHAVNPGCNQPLHSSLHRLLYYNGGTINLRHILSRLGVTVSEQPVRCGTGHKAVGDRARGVQWRRGHAPRPSDRRGSREAARGCGPASRRPPGAAARRVAAPEAQHRGA